MNNTPLFHFNFGNPLKTWWKARKYFKCPKIRLKVYFYKNYMYNFPYASYNYLGRIIDIDAHDVFWKDKYNSPRHEVNPVIFISLFRHISIWVTFNMHYIDELGNKQNGDTYYWEYLLSYLYYNDEHKDLLHPLLDSGAWTSDSKIWYTIAKYGKAEDGSEDEIKKFRIVVPTQLISLNKRGLEKLQEEIKTR